ncbi:tellurite resistance TerB family protein [Desulfonema magnum]|uniref:Tellurite resistance protein, TerB-like n=1 Tax=Desulfonema magnum TaxID=45655 RepID=A0A975BTZ4_9BACT|nr:tellurite resistance TerB family protein [Desulfonema magnum]QTA91194.1 Tellurite resistance protein, TerB-like [Desulfonema magnum]
MGLFDNVTTWTKTQAANLTEGVKKFRNKNFMEATVAGCAIVAFANGIVKPEEKAKMAGFIRRSEALNVFDMSQVITAFEKYVQSFEFDLQIGKAEALRTISKIRKNSDEARLLIRVCSAIGAADGDFDEDEKQVVREICQELGLDPNEFGLQVKAPAPSGSQEIKGKDDGIPEWMRKK